MGQIHSFLLGVLSKFYLNILNEFLESKNDFKHFVLVGRVVRKKNVESDGEQYSPYIKLNSYFKLQINILSISYSFIWDTELFVKWQKLDELTCFRQKRGINFQIFKK